MRTDRFAEEIPLERKITVIGSSNVDFIMKAPHLPQVGETVTD